jgi:hypothetical protein
MAANSPDSDGIVSQSSDGASDETIRLTWDVYRKAAIELMRNRVAELDRHGALAEALQSRGLPRLESSQSIRRNTNLLGESVSESHLLRVFSESLSLRSVSMSKSEAKQDRARLLASFFQHPAWGFRPDAQ